MNKVSILHLSAADPNTGAGGAAAKIHLALLKKGIDSKLLFIKDHAEVSRSIDSYANNWYRKILRVIFTTLDRVPVWFYPRRKYLFSPGIYGVDLKSHPWVKRADVIHLHWINHGFVRISELKFLDKTYIWTMHDMWPFTGGCHHSFGCEKYIDTCGNCPVLNSNRTADLSNLVLRNKISNIPVSRIKWVAISSWMRDSALKSKLINGQKVHIIPSGIDTKIFGPVDKVKARQELHLPQDKKIILLGAQDLSSPFKGLQFSIDALRMLSPDYLIVTFGNGELTSDKIKQNVINLKFINNPTKMATLYAAADLFLATSIAEAFGMTLAEAQCCGTPVVAFNATGPKDIVEHGVTGYLAEMHDISGLVKGIQYCIENGFDRKEIVKRANSLFSLATCVDKYVKLYECSLDVITLQTMNAES